MYPFICLYRGKKYEVNADTSFKAQQLAAVYFKAKKSYEITVMRADIQHKAVD